MKSRILLSLLLVSILVSCSSDREEEKISRSIILSELEELDVVLEERDAFVRLKMDSVTVLKERLKYAVDYESRRNILHSLSSAYNPYQFDSAVFYTKMVRNLAARHGDVYERDRANIRLGSLYAKSGFYMEAYSHLFHYVDVNDLAPALKRSWYNAAYSLADNRNQNSAGGEEFGRLEEASVYRDSLLSMYSPESTRWNMAMIMKHLDEGEFEKAREVNHRLLDGSRENGTITSPMFTYYETVICDSLGLKSEKLYWAIQGAKGDVRYAIKDYAALSIVAQELMEVDVDRAFNYMRVAMNDALFYNARLRPWQISRFMLGIQDSYNRRNEEYNASQQKISMLLMVFVMLLVATLVVLVIFYRKLHTSKEEMESLNLQLMEGNVKLHQMNEELTDANSIKERYITLCLSMMSDNINKIKDINNKVIKSLKYGRQDELMRELTAPTIIDDELNKFYEAFDTTFLAMYPDFVAKFNELLDDDAQCRPSKGEKLNTGLRVFALVRLGINDSDEIASLLKLSVRTVYNYKVKIRNSSKYPRQEFDAMLKKIR